MLAGGLALAALLLYLFVYRPLGRELDKNAAACRTAEGTLAAARGEASVLRGGALGGVLIPENEVPLALNELTRRGRLLGIQFVSVTPGEVGPAEGKPYRILPLEMEIDSRYEKLAVFLGALEELEKGLVTVGSFTAAPDSKEETRVRTRLTLHLHLSA